MNKKLVKKLNQINMDFYRAVADDFDSSRDYYWAGWKKVLDYVRENDIDVKSVLDVGCGNGRFGEFVREKLGSGVKYLGLDSCERLIESARLRVNDSKSEFVIADILNFDFNLPPKIWGPVKSPSE